MSDRLKEQVSELKLYSLGIVTENKPEGTDYILVTPIEKISIQEPGYINETQRTYKSTLKDIDGKENNQEIKATNKIRAKWIPFGHSNRLTAPDVRAGETVILFKFGDVDEYYWTTIFREPSLRRLENVVYGFSNIKGGTEAFDKNTSYWFQVDTIHKKVHLHTADNDGEYTAFDIFINTKKGIMIVTDNLGEIIEINAENNKINITTAKEVNITAPTINLNGNVNISGHLNVDNGSSLYGHNTIPNIGGNTNIDGNLTVNGNTSLLGSNTIPDYQHV